MKERNIKLYLILVFSSAWVLQVLASLMLENGNTGLYSAILAISMFMPLLSAMAARSGVKDIGWKPAFRRGARDILAAWFLPTVLAILGAILYYVLVPEAFDSTCSYMAEAIGPETVAELEAQGMSFTLLGAVSVVSAVTYAPIINMIFAVGEEAGWRGILYPALKERLGTFKGRLIGGTIWGAWHWPIMLLAGYEYGKEYWGSPFGLIVFCLITAALGIVFDELYNRSGCIWVPALAHGSFNAIAGTPTMFMSAQYADRLLLGPLMIGLIGGLPLIIAALLYSLRSRKTDGSDNPTSAADVPI